MLFTQQGYLMSLFRYRCRYVGCLSSLGLKNVLDPMISIIPTKLASACKTRLRAHAYFETIFWLPWTDGWWGFLVGVKMMSSSNDPSIQLSNRLYMNEHSHFSPFFIPKLTSISLRQKYQISSMHLRFLPFRVRELNGNSDLTRHVPRQNTNENGRQSRR